MNESLKARATELVALLKQGAQISRERNLNLDYAKVADQAADEIDRLTAERDAFKDTLQDVRGHYERVSKERDAARIILDETSLTLAKRSVERDALRADALRMNWLDNNIYSRENIDPLGKPDQKYTMWVTFAPKGVQGSARAIIDAAMKGHT